VKALKFETWNPANEFAARDEYIGALVGILMTLGGQRIKAIFRLLEIEYDPDIYDQGELLVKALLGCENPKLNELERYLFEVLGK